MTASILPANLADLERDLDAALARIGEVEIPISLLWDPWNCPLDVLPYLAWAVSVDMWRSDWPEVVKRRVVAGSFHLHRIKGTRPAVEHALAALGVEAEVTEWFEEQPPAERGTFSLLAWANENITPGQASILNSVLYDQLLAAVNNAKNTRSHFTFKVGAKFGPSPLRMGGAFAGGSLARREASPRQTSLDASAAVVAAPVLQSTGLCRRAGEVSIDASARPVSVMTGGSVAGASFVRVSMEVSV